MLLARVDDRRIPHAPAFIVNTRRATSIAWIGRVACLVCVCLANLARAEPVPPGIVKLSQVRSDAHATSSASSASSAPSIEVQVVVDKLGVARLDDERVVGPLRAAVEQALAQSRFVPATLDGNPVDARVRLTLQIERSPAATTPPAAATPPAATTPPAAATPPPAATPSAPDSAPGGSYRARARVRQAPATERTFAPNETRELPGAFGDPFRAVEAMPGVVPAMSGTPYVYVRGAPPAGTVYYYDDIQIPALFHLALGPAVVHPAMIGELQFHPSVAPARYGRYTGGVITSGAPARSWLDTTHGELELRLIDLMAMTQTPIGSQGGSLTLAGRYGYPGLILSVLSPDVVLAYWDYQSRLELPVSAHDRFQLSWFGSFDRVGDNDAPSTFTFHRVEARLIHEVGRLELGSALQLGYDRSQVERSFGVEVARIGPRVYLQWRDAGGVRVRVGADMLGTVGKLQSAEADDTVSFDLATPLYADVAARSASGAYAELHLPALERLDVDLGVRSDLWLTGSRANAAIDPRVLVTLRSSQSVAWHAAFGLAHQPAVFLLPLPGIVDIALDHGLQEAVQSEAGVKISLPAALQLEAQGYVQQFSNMLLPDLAIDLSESCGSLPPDVAPLVAGCDRGYPRASVLSYGVETFLRRDSREALSGWLSYTLGWADAEDEKGAAFTPSFDVRHVLSLVLAQRIGAGFRASARLSVRTGKLASATFLRAQPIRYEQRLPAFFRADVGVSYGWTTSWGRLQVSGEFMNLTMAQEANDIECEDGIDVGSDPRSATPCRVKYAPAIFFPNVGLRAEL